MFETIKDAFYITKGRIILLQPLIIFLLVTTFATLPLKSLSNSPIAFYAVLLNLLLLSVAFCCGWFGMVKKAILTFDKNELNNRSSADDIKLFKEFFPSVGEYFLPACGAFLILGIISTLFSILIFKVGTHFFANTDLLAQMFNQTMMPIDKQREFLTSLSDTELLTLNKYIFYFAFFYFLFNIMFLFFPAILFLKTKNPLKVLFQSICCAFKKPLLTIGIYFYL